MDVTVVDAMSVETQVDCEHPNQKYRNGDWVCRSCDAVVEKQEFDPDKLKSIKLNGLENWRQFQRLGKTQRESVLESNRAFEERTGRTPVPESGGRWI